VIEWMPRLAALATAIAALELVIVRDAFSDRGVYAWSVLRRDYGVLARPLGLIFSARGTLAVLVLQLAAAIALPLTTHAAPAWIAFGTSLAISVRWRGSYNGGSDAMLLVVLLAIAIGRTAPAYANAALAYAAVQLVLSYFIAGVAKLADPAWRAGRALPILVALPQYRVPARAAALLASPRRGRVLAYAMLAIECTFPLVRDEVGDARIGLDLARRLLDVDVGELDDQAIHRGLVREREVRGGSERERERRTRADLGRRPRRHRVCRRTDTHVQPRGQHGAVEEPPRREQSADGSEVPSKARRSDDDRERDDDRDLHGCIHRPRSASRKL